jgi:dipeptidyl aminopeptidase/acylaminoacyl peptidase
MKKIILFVALLFVVSHLLPAQSGPEINPYLENYIMKVPEEKMLYLPMLLEHFSPEELSKFSEEEVKALVLDSLNMFIADSGKYYKKLLMPDEARTIITPEILTTLKRVGSPQLSPDGKKMLYTVSTPNIKENNSQTKMYLYIFNLMANIPFFESDMKQYSPRWFPDNNRIAFISTADDIPQVFLTDTSFSKPKKLTNTKNGVSNLLVSPDGKYISYTTDVKIDQTPQEKYPALSKANIMIFHDLPVRHWDEWIDENWRHLFIQPVGGGKAVDVMANERFDTPLKPFDGVSDIAWAPDSKEIAYTCKKVDNFEWSTNSDIYVYNLKTGETKNITDGLPGFDKEPLYSPDGKWIAFHSQERAGFESDRIRLMLYNRETGKIHELSKTVDQWVGNMIWSPDSKFIYFSAEDGPVVPIYRIDVANGDWKILIEKQMNFDKGLQITPDGKYIVFGGRSMMQPTELYSVRNDGEQFTQLTYINEPVLRQLKKVDIRQRWIKSTDGKKFHTWVIYPPDFDSTKKYPLITYCQGGPQATISHYFSFRWNLYTFASQGYIVVAPNRRGMPGFGQAWNDAISKDWGGMPMTDILVATDEVSKEPYVDKDGMAAIGASAGGYAVFWLEGNHKGRFSAFVSHCGVFNLVSEYGATEELWFPNWENGGPYWEGNNKEYYRKNSPHCFADNWDTPILISTGMKDFRVPYTQSLEAYTVAQVKGIPSELIVFPEQNHWVLKPQESILWFHEVFDFLDKYCKKNLK